MWGPLGSILQCSSDYAKAFDCVDHNKLWKILQEIGIPDHQSSSFSYCSWGSQGKNTEVVCLPFSSEPHSVRPLHHDLPILGCPVAWLSFTEFDKAVVLVWLDWLVFCEYGFSVSALWYPLATPTIILGFLLPFGVGYLFTATPAKYSRCSLPWMRAVSSRHPSWPST